jgi:hypothetical protein
MARFTVGAGQPPGIPWAAPDAPEWRPDSALALDWSDGTFAFTDGGGRVLSGCADTTPFRVAFDLDGCEILGFGAATGGPDRNGTRFRVMTRDTLFYGIPGASYTAFPFFIARSTESTLGVLVATSDPLDVVVDDGKVAITAACDTGGAPVDIILFRGTVADIVRDLSALVGRPTTALKEGLKAALG